MPITFCPLSNTPEIKGKRGPFSMASAATRGARQVSQSAQKRHRTELQRTCAAPVSARSHAAVETLQPAASGQSAEPTLDKIRQTRRPWLWAVSLWLRTAPGNIVTIYPRKNEPSSICAAGTQQTFSGYDRAHRCGAMLTPAAPTRPNDTPQPKE